MMTQRPKLSFGLPQQWLSRRGSLFANDSADKNAAKEAECKNNSPFKSSAMETGTAKVAKRPSKSAEAGLLRSQQASSDKRLLHLSQLMSGQIHLGNGAGNQLTGDPEPLLASLTVASHRVHQGWNLQDRCRRGCLPSVHRIHQRFQSLNPVTSVKARFSGDSEKSITAPHGFCRWQAGFGS